MTKPTTLYRFLTGPDDSTFCHKISKALSQGWTLHGGPVYINDPQTKSLKCGQAVIKSSSEAYDPERKLGTY